MPFNKDILQENFFDLTNARNCNDLEHLKGFGIIFFISPSDLFKLIVENYFTRRRPLVMSKNHFKLLEGVSTTKASVTNTSEFCTDEDGRVSRSAMEALRNS
jgi:hypothetical protein